MAKIIPIDIVKNASDELATPLMIKTLKAACKFQANDEEFGQVDTDGSFTAAVKRGYIASKSKTINGKKKPIWFVTMLGRQALKSAGVNVAC